MFDLCRNTTIIARMIDTYFGITDSLKKYKKIGSDIAAVIEPSATYFVIKRTTKKTIKEKMADNGDNPKKTPHPVATPFPPLNFKNGVQICPATAQKPASIGYVNDGSGNIFLLINTGINPFRTSNKNVIAAGILPVIRQTLVAPGFPLP